MQPFTKPRIATSDRIEKCVLDLLSHRSALPFADNSPINFADRRDLRRRASKKCLVSI